VIPDAHPALVDRQTFERVQQRLKDNQTHTTPLKGGGDFLFSRMIFCGNCGSPMYLPRPAQVLPALPEEPQDRVRASGEGQAQADGAVEDILVHPDVVAVAAALEVDRPYQVDLVELAARARGPGNSWRGSSGARRTRGAVKPLRSRTRSMVRSQGSGRMPRLFNSARMGPAPVRL
jgi:hypothetical protein